MHTRRYGVVLLFAWGLCGLAGAQVPGVQRIVGPDGRVTYTDRPGAVAPAATPATPAAPASGASAAAAQPGSTALPFALRQPVQRYPVTLYSGNKCSACDSARNLLTQRGVPFVEKTVSTPEDAQAYARLSPENTLPLITLGAQRMVGFQADELNRYLDAAGYPAQSQLPRSHRNPPPQPLAAATAAPAGDSAEAAPAPLTAPVPAPGPAAGPIPAANPPAANPAGIRF